LKDDKQINGFSKRSKAEKLQWVIENFFNGHESAAGELRSFWLDDETQNIFDAFSENSISNFILPYGVAPNMLINGKTYCVPMVTEESSVVAAAAAAAKYWSTRGGIKATVVNTKKIGQVHFKWSGQTEKLISVFPELKKELIITASAITTNMDKRGGGILDIELKDLSDKEPDYYQLFTHFDTCDSMGANFINSVLEQFGRTLRLFIQTHPAFDETDREVDIIMCILSNYTPECLVKAEVSCTIDELGDECLEMDAVGFAERFATAIRIAEIDSYRATTHNKGIFNGIDAVVIATGNDFRAIEASGHTYAARSGIYKSLSKCTIKDNIFSFNLEIPLAIGTIGGLTKLHPIARHSLEMLGHPSAPELMTIIAATGLMQNFAAIRSLVTTGIQKGHMKMHLMNILNHLSATEQEIEQAFEYFSDKVISFTSVRELIREIREREHKIITD